MNYCPLGGVSFVTPWMTESKMSQRFSLSKGGGSNIGLEEKAPAELAARFFYKVKIPFAVNSCFK